MHVTLNLANKKIHLYYSCVPLIVVLHSLRMDIKAEGDKKKSQPNCMSCFLLVGSVGLFVHPFDLQQPKNKHIFHVELRE